MRFNVAGLSRNGIGATQQFEVDEDLLIEGRGPERVTGHVELLKTRDGVLVRAHLSLVESEACSRCLKPIEEPVSLGFEEEFLSTVDVLTGAPVRDIEDRDAFTIDGQHILDLTEAVRQYREVSLEMQPLCRPDCRGLCERGHDLNLGECDCEEAVIDSRWAVLATLRAADPEGKQ